MDAGNSAARSSPSRVLLAERCSGIGDDQGRTGSCSRRPDGSGLISPAHGVAEWLGQETAAGCCRPGALRSRETSALARAEHEIPCVIARAVISPRREREKRCAKRSATPCAEGRQYGLCVRAQIGSDSAIQLNRGRETQDRAGVRQPAACAWRRRVRRSRTWSI